MKIGIIGTGHVGGTLGSRWAQGGHDVTFGTRHPDSPEIQNLLAKSGGSARAATVAQAVANSAVVLLATPWNAARDAIAGAGNLSGKVLIDAMNPLLPDMSGLAAGTTTSAGELVAQWAPEARVVKAFNSVGYNTMAEPVFGDERAVMFYCGDDTGAKQTVRDLAAQLGFDPVDAGPLNRARLLEPFALLWISLAYGGYSREIGFRFMRREARAGA